MTDLYIEPARELQLCLRHAFNTEKVGRSRPTRWEAQIGAFIRGKEAAQGHKGILPVTIRGDNEVAEARKARFMELYEQGKSRAEICEAMNMSRTRISQIAGDCGVSFQ